MLSFAIPSPSSTSNPITVLQSSFNDYLVPDYIFLCVEKYAHRYKFLSQISSDRSGVVAARQWNRRRPHWVSFRVRRVVGGRAALVPRLRMRMVGMDREGNDTGGMIA